MSIVCREIIHRDYWNKGLKMKTKNTNDELLSCPFCGGKAKLWERKRYTAKYGVGCVSKEYCYAWIPSNVRLSELHTYTSCFVGKQDAIDCWNKRAALNEADALRAEVEGLERQLATIRAMEMYMVASDTNSDVAFMRDFFREKLGDAIRHAAIKPNAAAGEEGTDGK